MIGPGAVVEVTHPVRGERMAGLVLEECKGLVKRLGVDQDLDVAGPCWLVEVPGLPSWTGAFAEADIRPVRSESGGSLTDVPRDRGRDEGSTTDGKQRARRRSTRGYYQGI